jgi:hypothetical protein
MQATGSSETLVPSYQTIRRHIPIDCDHNTHRCENLKSLIVIQPSETQPDEHMQHLGGKTV